MLCTGTLSLYERQFDKTRETPYYRKWIEYDNSAEMNAVLGTYTEQFIIFVLNLYFQNDYKTWRDRTRDWSFKRENRYSSSHSVQR